ncbi:MAG: L-fucokinase [Thermoguttaceae bacterium]
MWHYLILTASNDAQAAAYRTQLELRRQLGLLAPVREALVVTDPDGRRVGSGGSTVCCLLEVLSRELARGGQAGSVERGGAEVVARQAASEDPRAIEPEGPSYVELLRRLRILIVHAGGDSRRLPAYGPCGKVFVPLPDESDSAVGVTLFDRQLPTYLALPPAREGAGQVVITAGDVLLGFDPGAIDFAADGVTGLGCWAAPEQAAGHGVYCTTSGGQVRRFLQKPSPAVQLQEGAVNAYGQSVLDIGVFSLDVASAAGLLELCQVRPNAAGRLAWSGPLGEAIEAHGLDFYREICCALGAETTRQRYLAEVRSTGSAWNHRLLEQVHRAVSTWPCRVQVLKQCQFLHFGANRQLIDSGLQLARSGDGFFPSSASLSVNNRLEKGGKIAGPKSWVEGCRVAAPLLLAGDNLVVGADVEQPLELPAGACLDVLPGRNHCGAPVTFIRCYHIDDPFHNTPAEQTLLCGLPVQEWLKSAGGAFDSLWDPALAKERRSAWNARLFPAEPAGSGEGGDAGARGRGDAETGAGSAKGGDAEIGAGSSPEARQEISPPCSASPRPRVPASRCSPLARWLWMFRPERASAEEFRAWYQADRYSLEEMAQWTDQEAFHRRRMQFHADGLLDSLPLHFRRDSRFSAIDLACVLARASEPEAWLAGLLDEARRREQAAAAEPVEEAFAFSRIMHSLGSAILGGTAGQSGGGTQPGLFTHEYQPEAQARAAQTIALAGASGWYDSAHNRNSGTMNHPGQGPLTDWLDAHGLSPALSAADWAERARAVAFESLRKTIVTSGGRSPQLPASALRSDEIVWGRAPARLDLAGGWTDTPPYALEHGGTVLNAAVLLNGQPPVQVFARVTPKPILRVRSIDLGTHLDIDCWDDLFDYSSAVGEFSLVKAALVLCGFTPSGGGSPRNRPLREVLTGFGGGLELTTLAAIPKGSGLGTSSIMGAVLLAVIHRVLGRQPTPTELFHGVLRLEQELTTGGGWQDQIGGAVGGLKLVTTGPGLVPEPTIRYVPADVLDPNLNGGQTLLFYTGMTRLAKNILQNVVGQYLDRDRRAMDALTQLGKLAPQMTEAMARKDLPEFGRLIDRAWQLNKQLDPHSTTDEIESLLARIRPHILGAKLLGAGGGGFLLLVARSPGDAGLLRSELESSPPNARARFFNFSVSDEGLAVSVC